MELQQQNVTKSRRFIKTQGEFVHYLFTVDRHRRLAGGATKDGRRRLGRLACPSYWLCSPGFEYANLIQLMPDIVLTTLNAKYIHAALGLRYLLANLGDLRSRAGLVEFDINQRPIDVVEALLARQPKIIGFGVYIWNALETTRVISTLKRVRPELCVIIGGPEVSFEIERQEIVQLADYVITGEADNKFAEVCRRLLAANPPPQKVIPAGIALPRLPELLFEFLTRELGLASRPVASALLRDYRRGGRSDTPPFLRDHITHHPQPARTKPGATCMKRQARHLAQFTPE